MINPGAPEAKKIARQVESWITQGDDDLGGCVWIGTSGSSGQFRFVCLSKAGLLASAAAVNRHLQVKPTDRWLCALPEFHVGGLSIYVRGAQADCEVISLDGSWDPEHFRDALAKHQITLTSLVPTQVYDLVSKRYQCPESLRAVVIGGEGLDSGLGERARELGWPVLQTYGLTEAGSQVATESIEALGNGFSGEWLAVLSCWEVRVKSGEDRLEIKGEPLCRGYLEFSENDKIEYIEAGDAEGWFTTNDRVDIRDNDGGPLELTVLGRVDDVIKILGEQVSMNLLNQRFQGFVREHGDTIDGFLLALPDERKGHQILAAVAADEESARSLLNAYQAQAAPYERIDGVRIVGEIPRSALGKVKRQDLMAVYEEGTSIDT